jgi:hypothetical protein
MNPFEQCGIDEIASIAEVIGVEEVNKHYE